MPWKCDVSMLYNTLYMQPIKIYVDFIQFSWTALMSASEKGHPEVVKILLEAGASRSLTKKKVQKFNYLTTPSFIAHLNQNCNFTISL